MEPSRQKVLMIDGPREVSFHDRPLPAPGPQDVVVRPLLSTFKHGTEMMAYSGNSPFAGRTFNSALRLFEDRAGAEGFYPRPVGSMMVGEVAWAGADARRLMIGERVYALGADRRRHVLPAASVEPLGGLMPQEALCIDPASFALGAVIDGAIAASDTVFVTGLGAIGLFVIQYCNALGARVIAASTFEKRRKLAAALGASEVYDPETHPDLARLIKENTGGVNASIECSGNIGTLHQAIRATRRMRARGLRRLLRAGRQPA